ncbi:PhoH family protein [candidate division KSB1 bacterium]|nr:MAG: phosphate starvation-inducible protein PhoH [candidate division KSB1 bacterium 4484_219]RKY81064.1 MAG: PhoH family protein [candidate division KSB1 bacterium]RKY86192.1 MAG: PhoH family protein [candidate division KSB1 bacterium]RKY92826.1 MAG: PhoH family protein [candidate division KSB1 bacterium]HDI51483.1 PhoH family protein [Bacteroidota bacterium]
MMQKKFSIKGIDQLQLLGFQDANLRLIQQHFNAKITVRGSIVSIEGTEQEVREIEKLFSELIMLVNHNGGVTRKDVETLINLIRTEKDTAKQHVEDLSSVILSTKSGFIRPKTPGQQRYYRSTLKNDIVFVIGPAGTGKTYLAVAIAVAHLKAGEVERLILTRPAVEAGESLGFLPGDFREKVDPYLRPLYDALYDMMPTDKLRRMLERGEIEIAPLAYMRGRTLNNAFVILDEAQNTSALQMKMFLTRLGVSSKAIITGDITQVDIPDKRKSGLIQIQSVLQGIEGIDFVYLDDRDVVRHRLVREIIKAYDLYDDKSQNISPNQNESSSESKTAN